MTQKSNSDTSNSIRTVTAQHEVFKTSISPFFNSLAILLQKFESFFNQSTISIRINDDEKLLGTNDDFETVLETYLSTNDFSLLHIDFLYKGLNGSKNTDYQLPIRVSLLFQDTYYTIVIDLKNNFEQGSIAKSEKLLYNAIFKADEIQKMVSQTAVFLMEKIQKEL